MMEETQSGEIRADCFGYVQDKRRCRAVKVSFSKEDCTGCKFYKTEKQRVEEDERGKIRRAQRGLRTSEDYAAAYKATVREIAEENRKKKQKAEANNAETQNEESAVIENEPNERRIDLDNPPKPSGKRKRLTKEFLWERFAELKAAGRFFENADDIPRVDELAAMRVWKKIRTGQTAKITGAEGLTYHVILKKRKLPDGDNEAIDAAFEEIRDRAEKLLEIIPYGGDYGERRAILELYYMECYTSAELGAVIGMKPGETYSYIVRTLERLIEEARTWIMERQKM